MPAILNSNSGTQSLVIELLTPSKYAEEAGFEASLQVNSRHWDGENMFPFKMSVEGIWLRADDLAQLKSHVGSWTARPMAQLIPEDLDGRFSLARLPGQELDIVFGEREEVISERKPVVSIVIAAGPQKFEFRFVTDQSCLAAFAEAL